MKINRNFIFVVDEQRKIRKGNRLVNTTRILK